MWRHGDGGLVLKFPDEAAQLARHGDDDFVLLEFTQKRGQTIIFAIASFSFFSFRSVTVSVFISLASLPETNGGLTDENLKKAKRVLYDLKTEIRTTVGISGD